MNKFKIGDTVAAYSCQGMQNKKSVGVVQQVTKDNVIFFTKELQPVYFHYKQCRLVKRPLEIWLNKNGLAARDGDGFQYTAHSVYIKYEPTEGFTKFREVKNGQANSSEEKS